MEVAPGTYYSQDSFKKNIVVSKDSRTNRILAEVPRFSQTYTWRTIHIVGHNKIESSALHHFSVRYSADVDTAYTRLHVLENTGQYAGAYVFLDDYKALFDMDGHAVWFLPKVDNTLNDSYLPRDIKITPQGTITLIILDQVYEINYNGDILWKNPEHATVSGQNKESFHHEFTRLSNGHYMALASEPVNIFVTDSSVPGGIQTKIVSQKDSARQRQQPGWHFLQRSALPTIIEYNKNGDVVWSYHSSKYFEGSDLCFHKIEGYSSVKIHDNAFYLDEKKQQLYISCKGLSRILKIKYPEGTLLDIYGELFAPGAIQNKGKGLFCGQHACKVDDEGYLYLFNNNDCNLPELPTLVMMQQPTTERDSLKKIWEYQCTVEGLDDSVKKNLRLTSGGNIIELPDHNIFASMGSGYSKAFIVTRDKKILWSALPERWNKETKKWEPNTVYRASTITDRSLLEKLIWGSESDQQ